MNMENKELLIFASALIMITLSILVYSLSAGTKKYQVVSIWIIRATAIIPGFLAVCGGMYIKFIENDMSVGWALFSAGILLEIGALQLSRMLCRQIDMSNKAN